MIVGRGWIVAGAFLMWPGWAVAISRERHLVLPPTVAVTVQAAPAPTFTDPVALVAWLLQNSGRGFDPLSDAATAPVFSPGLRAALRTTMARSRRLGEPPCGANGDIIRASQEDGRPQDVRLSAQVTAPDRRTVSASFNADGYQRNRRYMTVLLDGVWKLENIVEVDGRSLRRSLESPC